MADFQEYNSENKRVLNSKGKTLFLILFIIIILGVARIGYNAFWNNDKKSVVDTEGVFDKPKGAIDITTINNDVESQANELLQNLQEKNNEEK